MSSYTVCLPVTALARGLIAAGLFFSPAHAEPVPVPLPNNIRVIDGDTVVIDGTHYRLWGIDAPELHQMCGVIACGERAKETLIGLIHAGGIVCHERSTDKYGRKVATCRNRAGWDLNGEMVHQGWAMDYTQYSQGEYMHFQTEAREHRWGIWMAPFVEEPWNWRKDHGK